MSKTEKTAKKTVHFATDVKPEREDTVVSPHDSSPSFKRLKYLLKYYLTCPRDLYKYYENPDPVLVYQFIVNSHLIQWATPTGRSDTHDLDMISHTMAKEEMRKKK